MMWLFDDFATMPSVLTIKQSCFERTDPAYNSLQTRLNYSHDHEECKANRFMVGALRKTPHYVIRHERHV